MATPGSTRDEGTVVLADAPAPPSTPDRRIPLAFALALPTLALGGAACYLAVQHRVTAHALAQPAGALQASLGEWMAALFGGGLMAVLVFILVLVLGRKHKP